MTTAPAAHRLRLTGPQWTVLCRVAGMTPPPDFAPAAPPQAGTDDDAAAGQAEVVGELVELRVLVGPDQVHPSVAANLTVLARPAAVVRAEASIGTDGLRAAFAVRGSLGASLFAQEHGGVELSMFPSVRLGYELIRCVPETPPRPGLDIAEGLRGNVPVPGRVPLLALGGRDPGLEPLAMSAAESELAQYLNAHTVGGLRCVVAGPAIPVRDGATADRATLAGAVVWWLTTAGWVGLRPVPDGSGRQVVEVAPVRREEIGSWLAPYLAAILEVNDEPAVA